MKFHPDDIAATEKIIARVKDPAEAAKQVAAWVEARLAVYMVRNSVRLIEDDSGNERHYRKPENVP